MSNTNCLLNDKHFVKYSIKIKTLLGSKEAATLFDRCEYWSKRSGGKKEFWKFSEPCKHPLYKHGDSWEEETGFKRRVFKKHFALFGAHYKTKADYLREQDPFKGMPYASYHNRKKGVIVYARNNEEAVNQFIMSLSQKFTGKKTSKTKDATPAKIISSGSSRKCKQGRSNITETTSLDYNSPKSPLELEKGWFGEKKEKGNKKLKRKKEENLKKTNPVSTPLITEEELEKAQKMRDIWLETTDIFVPRLSFAFAKLLSDALLEHFKDSFERFKRYCLRIASSKRLTGKLSTYKMWLRVAIKQEEIEKIKAGEYGVDASIELIPLEEKKQNELAETAEILEEIRSSSQPLWEKALKTALIEGQGIHRYRSWFKDIKFFLTEGEGRGTFSKKSFKEEGGCQKLSLLTLLCESDYESNWIKQNCSAFFDKLIQNLGIGAFEVRCG